MLNFRNCEAKARVVKVEENEKFSVVKLRTARKPQNSDQWINSTFSFVRFLGESHKKIGKLVAELEQLDTFDNGDAKGGVPILIQSASLSNEPYEKNGEKVYPKNYQLIVWAWKFPDEEDSPKGKSMDRPPVVEDDSDYDDDDSIPF